MSELLNSIFSEASKLYNVRIFNRTDGRLSQPFIIPQIYKRFIELDKDITILKTMMSDKTLSDEELKAIQSGIDALMAKQKFFSSETIKKRQHGIQKAKEKNRYKGRVPIDVDNDIFEKEYARYMHREITKGDLANILHISRPTLNKIIKNHKEK